MPTASERIAHREPWRLPAWLGLCLFLAIAGFFLWEEHRAHLLGALPYVLLLFRLPPAVATLVTLVMFPMLVTVYVRLARREEREVRAKFGAVWGVCGGQTTVHSAASERHPANWAPPKRTGVGGV